MGILLLLDESGSFEAYRGIRDQAFADAVEWCARPGNLHEDDMIAVVAFTDQGLVRMPTTTIADVRAGRAQLDSSRLAGGGTEIQPAPRDEEERAASALPWSLARRRRSDDLAGAVRCWREPPDFCNKRYGEGAVSPILSGPGDGRVLVVDASGSLHIAVLGDMIAIANNRTGIIVTGAGPRVANLGDLPIGIKSLGSNPRKSKKLGGGDRDIVVQLDSATFRPGHTLHSDDHGVVALPQIP